MPRIDVSDLYTNVTLDLGQFFQRLPKEAGIHKISQLKLAPKKTLEVISIESLKNMGKIILNTLRVALLKPVAIIENKKDQEAILFTHHDDLMQGSHAGITKTINKTKRHYYWRNMTRSVKEYVRT